MKVRELFDIANEAIKAEQAVQKEKPFLLVEDTIIDEILDKPLPLLVHFHRVRFDAALFLNEAVFPAGVIFIDVDFCEEVHFSYCHFKGPAYFWKCRFHKDADFSHIVVLKEEFEGGRLERGETNFSYTEFCSKADFRHAVFKGKTYFWRTVFNSDVVFEAARFEEAAVFMGKNHDICVYKREFDLEGKPNDIAEKLAILKILGNCEDRKKDSGYYNFDSTIASLSDLKTKLSPSTTQKKESIFSKKEVEQITKVWNEYECKYMFNSNEPPNFIEALFGPDSWFRHISLRRCRLLRANLSQTQFDGIWWQDHTAFDSTRKWLGCKGVTIYSCLKQKAIAMDGWLKLKIRGFNDLHNQNAPELSGWLDVGYRNLNEWFKSNDLAFQKTETYERWLTRKVFFFHRRSCIYDEVRLAEAVRDSSPKARPDRVDCDWIQTESMEVSRVYHQLRSAAEKVGARGLARNFYYGEMEMARKAPPWRSRSVLAFLYKFLSGYGTLENMALLILLLLMLVVFPSCYWFLSVHGDLHLRDLGGLWNALVHPRISLHFANSITFLHDLRNWYHGITRDQLFSGLLSSETTSLEASTFLPRTPPEKTSLEITFVESVERIFVSIQAGLFVLSLKSRFQRGPE